MRTLDVRQLAARLKQELRAVSRGEVILVTDRGRVLAELRAPSSASIPAKAPLDKRLEQWIRDGRARIDDAEAPAAYPPSPVELPAGTAERLLDELRGPQKPWV